MKCGCNCSAKCGLLGSLEQKIMEIVWQSDKPLKPAEVLNKIDGDYAYTTIMTVLKRMADKEILTRHSSGNTFLSSANQNKILESRDISLTAAIERTYVHVHFIFLSAIV